MTAGTAIVGLGDPILDLVANVSTEFLQSVTEEPGGCVSIDAREMEELVKRVELHAGASTALSPGGSAANVMKGLAQLAGTRYTCRFMGMIGADRPGKVYKRALREHDVEPLLLESNEAGVATARCACLVTGDGQRTMRTHLGASVRLQAASQLPAGWTDGCRLLHCEGYCLYRPELTREAMRMARKAGGQVSMDLGSFEVVRGRMQHVLQLLKDGLLDLVFCNEQEADALALQAGCDPSTGEAERLEAAERFLVQYCKACVITLGSRGCRARSWTGERARSPSCRVQVVDTVGAGDNFCAGFLHAWLTGGSLQTCTVAGCAVGTEAVQQVGAELSAAAWHRLRRTVSGDILQLVPEVR